MKLLLAVKRQVAYSNIVNSMYCVIFLNFNTNQEYLYPTFEHNIASIKLF